MLRLTKHADKSGGEPRLSHVTVDGDVPELHNFADTFVARSIRDGFLSFENQRIVSTEVDGVAYDRDPVISGDAIVLDVEGGPLTYRVLRHPGRYKLADGSVEVIHEYECELVKASRPGKGK